MGATNFNRSVGHSNGTEIVPITTRVFPGTRWIFRIEKLVDYHPSHAVVGLVVAYSDFRERSEIVIRTNVDTYDRLRISGKFRALRYF